MRKKRPAFFFLLLIAFFTTAQTRHEVDSMMNQLNKAGKDTAHINLLLRLAEFEIFKPREFMDTDPDSSLEKISRALDLYQSVGYKNLQGVYDLFGRHYMEKTDYTKALSYEMMALKTAEENRDSTMQLCEIDFHIASIYYRLEDSAGSLTYLKAALRIAETYKDIVTIYFLTLNLTTYYTTHKAPLAAKAIIDEVSRKYPLPKDNLKLEWQYAVNYLRVYTMLRQFRVAGWRAEELEKITAEHDLEAGDRADIYMDLIRYFLADRQYAKMQAYLTKADTLVKKLGTPAQLKTLNGLRFSLDTARHDYKTAMVHLLKYNQLQDSIFTETKTKQIEQLQIQFETKKKENQIALLNQQSGLEESKVREARLFKNVTIAGIVLALIITGLLFRQNKIRRKNNTVVSQKNQLLQHLVTEKEWLLKEVHHRVKNNLHTVICLLESQAIYLENDALKAIENSQHRIYAMSLIHQKLYQSEDIKTIDMTVYFMEFLQYLSESFGSPDNIYIRRDIQAVKLGVSQAIPLGLIINEAVTNAFKYAFPGNARGEIRIDLSETGEKIRLIIADNGIGLPSRIGCEEPDSLGVELMKGLTRDLNGTILFETDKGTRITLVFSADPFDTKLLPYSTAASKGIAV